MDAKLENFTKRNFKMLSKILVEATRLDFNLDGYGIIAKNEVFGNVYVWSEEESFTLFCSEFGSPGVFALWSNPENGKEFYIKTKGKNREHIDKFISNCENGKTFYYTKI